MLTLKLETDKLAIRSVPTPTANILIALDILSKNFWDSFKSEKLGSCVLIGRQEVKFGSLKQKVYKTKFDINRFLNI